MEEKKTCVPSTCKVANKMASFQCCGDPRISCARSRAIEQARADYLQANGQQSAALFDEIYGYGATGGCDGNVSYYRQQQRADGTHCQLPHYASRQQQLDQYRALNCNALYGWDKRMQRPLASCCSYAGSCNGTLPYPYGQVQLRHCDPQFGNFTTTAGAAAAGASCSACGHASQSRYTYALNEPYRYPRPPYPAAYYQNHWPYGEQAPDAQTVEAVAQRAAASV